jgi:predicted transcriptional regulator
MLDPDTLAELTRDPRRAISADAVACLVCGVMFRHLTNTHLGRHGLTSSAYKERFGYNGRRSLMALDLRRTHASNVTRRGSRT